MQIGAEARAEKKHFQLAQIYDEMCRRKWAERAFRGMLFPTPFMACASVLSQCAGDPGFSVSEASECKDLELLNRARLRWEEENKKSAGKASGGKRVVSWTPARNPVLSPFCRYEFWASNC